MGGLGAMTVPSGVKMWSSYAGGALGDGDRCLYPGEGERPPSLTGLGDNERDPDSLKHQQKYTLIIINSYLTLNKMF